MSDMQAKLSAFLDGELSEAETLEMEAALNSDRALRAELEVLAAADAFAVDAFEKIANEPVPSALAATIQNAPEPEIASPSNSLVKPARWMMAAAAVVALSIGGVSGYVTGTAQNQTIV
ncbi:MAG: zf-HC2 domain-containing protein, partial [Pseudomonadota bacterium]